MAEGGDGGAPPEEEEMPPDDPETQAAALKIQAVHRGKAARREVGEKKAASGAPAEAPPAAPVEVPSAGGGDAAAADPAAQAAADEAQAAKEREEEERAATRIQAIHRGKTTRRGMMQDGKSATGLTPRGEDGAGLLPLLAAMAKDYRSAMEAQGRKPNHLVETSLLECAEAKQSTWFIHAPGSHKLVFTNRIDDAAVSILFKALAAPMPYLAKLDLSFNLLTDAGAETLAKGIGQRLQFLSVKANSIGPTGCELLCQALRSCPLEYLDFSRNSLGRSGGLILVELLQGSPRLQELYIADTEADIDVMVALAAVLLTGVPQLKVCDIENPRIQTLQEDHTVHLGRMLRVNTCLCEVYLGKHKMRDEGVRQLVSFLLENKTLRLLDLRCNELGADGAKHVATLLSMDCQIATLNLSGNRIGERANASGARALGQALLSNRMLTCLDLNGNQLCGEALLAIAEAVDTNSTLERINLFYNQWDQPSSYKFHQILNDRARLLPVKADFITSPVDLRIDVCQVQEPYLN